MLPHEKPANETEHYRWWSHWNFTVFGVTDIRFTSDIIQLNASNGNVLNGHIHIQTEVSTLDNGLFTLVPSNITNINHLSDLKCNFTLDFTLIRYHLNSDDAQLWCTVYLYCTVCLYRIRQHCPKFLVRFEYINWFRTTYIFLFSLLSLPSSSSSIKSIHFYGLISLPRSFSHFSNADYQNVPHFIQIDWRKISMTVSVSIWLDREVIPYIIFSIKSDTNLSRKCQMFSLWLLLLLKYTCFPLFERKKMYDIVTMENE